MADVECHISSLVVHVRPERETDIAVRVGRLGGAEVMPPQTTGKLIVTLETASTGEIMDRLNAIQDLPGVISATLIYHHWEAAGDGEADAESEADHGPIAPQVSEG